MGFAEDLEYGEFWERKAIQMLKADAVRKMEGKFAAFDYVVCKNGNIELVEIKADRYCLKSGNIAIECHCNGKDSGIFITKADYWLIVLPSKEPVYYKVPVHVLKKMIERQEYSEIKAGGDNHSNIMFLFKKECFNDFIFTEGCLRLSADKLTEPRQSL